MSDEMFRGLRLSPVMFDVFGRRQELLVSLTLSLHLHMMLPTFLSALSSSACEEANAEFQACKEGAEEQHPEIVYGAVEAKDTLMTCLDEEDAKGKADDNYRQTANAKMKECIKTYSDFFKPYCPVVIETLFKACGFSSLEFEDFALDLAEDERTTAYATHLRG